MPPAGPEIEGIAKKVHLGVLRRDEPERTWGGLGDGLTCDGCARTIATSEFEIEADFDRGTTTLHFHAGCFLVWHRAAQAEDPTAT